MVIQQQTRSLSALVSFRKREEKDYRGVAASGCLAGRLR